MKKVLIVIGIIVIATVAGIIWYKKDTGTTKGVEDVNTTQDQTQTTQAKDYFDENAKVMFFYSDECSWCNKEKVILQDLSTAGYRVKPMDVAAHSDYWTKYSISGTPTFISASGTKLTGYQTKENLQKFLDENK